jgi:aspartyl-tRNA(Asn)/glutamyl-tRNA(Gln) amidotransferase subunit B
MSGIIEGSTGKWEMVIGLEVHAQVTANSKLFSGAPTDFGGEPNTQVSLVDAAMPGMLPVLNEYCVEQAIKTGLGLGAHINKLSVFERKNYFYPDLPQGYQISQYAHPIVGKGEIEIDLPDGSTKAIGVTRLHLEQDAGKSLHDQHASKTFVDLNRSGQALMEIVSEPDMRSADEAAAYVRKLRTILRYLGTCDGNMDEGSMRCDVNLSMRRAGTEKYGTRCEIKNVNSIRFVQAAIEYEARRQVEVLEEGGEIVQETRLWDPRRGETRSMRSKEEAFDYRYFPDPDLLPLELTDDQISRVRAELPELPDAKKKRFTGEYGLPAYDAGVLVAEQALAAYFEKALNGKRSPKLVANWIITELLGKLNKIGHGIEASPIPPDALGELVDLIEAETINGRQAKDVFVEMFDTSKRPNAIVEAKGMRQVTDITANTATVMTILARNPDKVAEYRAGKDKLLGFFVGQVMKESGGKANPAQINELLKEKLAES